MTLIQPTVSKNTIDTVTVAVVVSVVVVDWIKQP